jgi:threonine dehydratase
MISELGKSTMIRPTTILEPVLLARRFGLRVLLATETFQHTGSFKFRALGIW